jgi:thioredoxin-like negative regulator of GroEL
MRLCAAGAVLRSRSALAFGCAKSCRGTFGRLLVLKVNTEGSPIPAQRYEISGIPTFILFASGQEVTRRSGALPATTLKQFAAQAS